MNDANSVVMSFHKITPYLDKALSALGLHTEERTSFITYWLPSLLKHKTVACAIEYDRMVFFSLLFFPDSVTNSLSFFLCIDSPCLLGTRVLEFYREVTSYVQPEKYNPPSNPTYVAI
ncbi:hypothetical protein CPB84DRAFT_1928784 [Gymnopilus junonius]|uniref:Uncharacterized protein n=1 Tax=Gymnopilus junonius TaxID=109634 RepID=A0A9P5NNI2_GYMJU|nr:hypothetical protein CPB84DRAFT_1928784 [Gymnopilus junonius]